MTRLLLMITKSTLAEPTNGCLVFTGGDGDHLPMVKPRNLRHPISATIDGKSITLVSVGHIAAELGRTRTCLRQWEDAGTFPPAPYRLVKGQLRLYPADFLKAIRQIKQERRLGKRLDETDRRLFQLAVWHALDLALAPMRIEPNVVTDSSSGAEGGEVARGSGID